MLFSPLWHIEKSYSNERRTNNMLFKILSNVRPRSHNIEVLHHFQENISLFSLERQMRKYWVKVYVQDPTVMAFVVSTLRGILQPARYFWGGVCLL